MRNILSHVHAFARLRSMRGAHRQEAAPHCHIAGYRAAGRPCFGSAPDSTPHALSCCHSIPATHAHAKPRAQAHLKCAHIHVNQLQNALTHTHAQTHKACTCQGASTRAGTHQCRAITVSLGVLSSRACTSRAPPLMCTTRPGVHTAQRTCAWVQARVRAHGVAGELTTQAPPPPRVFQEAQVASGR